MTAASYAERYVADVAGWAANYKRLADRSMIQFLIVRIILIVLSTSLPALTANSLVLASSISALVIAVLTGLDTQFKWGEEWKHFRLSQLNLERLLRQYRYVAAALDEGRAVGKIVSPSDNIDNLVHDVELLMQSEADSFFQFRVTDWSAGRSGGG